MRPAPIASAAEISDHQKPGIWRAKNVMARPAMPLTRNIQPRKIVTARLASGGTMMAARPSTASSTPSNRNAFQCSRTAGLILDCRLVMSCGKLIANLLMRRCKTIRNDGADRRTIQLLESRPLEAVLSDCDFQHVP